MNLIYKHYKIRSLILNIETGIRNRCLIFERNSLDLPSIPGGTSQYRCQIVVEEEGRFMGLSQEVFLVNDPPYNGSCRIFPEQGTQSLESPLGLVLLILNGNLDLFFLPTVKSIFLLLIWNIDKNLDGMIYYFTKT